LRRFDWSQIGRGWIGPNGLTLRTPWMDMIRGAAGGANERKNG
jgi:hypothetical protein